MAKVTYTEVFEGVLTCDSCGAFAHTEKEVEHYITCGLADEVIANDPGAELKFDLGEFDLGEEESETWGRN